jgi:hypothetical protein
MIKNGKKVLVKRSFDGSSLRGQGLAVVHDIQLI